MISLWSLLLQISRYKLNGSDKSLRCLRFADDVFTALKRYRYRLQYSLSLRSRRKSTRSTVNATEHWKHAEDFVPYDDKPKHLKDILKLTYEDFKHNILFILI